MGGIAAIARQAGHRVTGCDANVYPPMSEQLRSLGVDLIEGYDADQMALSPDCWVVGNVVTRGNPLMEAILDSGERFISGPQWLRESVLLSKWVLAVAGTHGKTTTSSILAWILERSGMTPGYLIGGVPNNFEHTARLTDSVHFVIEADEYDTAFFDKRSKFVHYCPRTAVLNNLEYDHADIFEGLADITRQFHHFVRMIPRSGRIVSNGRDVNVKHVLTYGKWSPVEEFGVDPGWQAGQPDDGGSFDVAWAGHLMGRVRWTQTGEHNRLNALAAIAAARHAGVDPKAAIEALASFSGVKRRLELRGESRGILVYDDFAHHPTAIAATLQGLRQSAPAGRILAVLEPRSNTMKRGVMKHQLPESLAGADLIFVHAAGLDWDPHAVFDSDRACIAENLDALVEAIAVAARPGDRVLAMSNGGFGGFHAKLLARLEQGP